MDVSTITPDQMVLWKWGLATLNATILYTWLVMSVLVIGSWLVTRRLSTGTHLPRWQHALEVLVLNIRHQIRDVSHQEPDRFVPFVGTLFLFIAVSNLLTIVPGFLAPTSSLSTTAALSLCVFTAIPLFGIAQQGIRRYLNHYLQPSVLMAPFHIVGEISRTLALAIRLFGNVMSGDKIVAILLAITPLFFPIVMRAFGLLIGLIQAYIFATLAMVYIASAIRAHEGQQEQSSQDKDRKGDSPHG